MHIPNTLYFNTRKRIKGIFPIIIEGIRKKTHLNLWHGYVLTRESVWIFIRVIMIKQVSVVHVHTRTTSSPFAVFSLNRISGGSIVIIYHFNSVRKSH